MKLEWQALGGATARTLESARARWSDRRGLLLRLHGEDGVAGHGEASPLPGYSLESIEDCLALLQEGAGASARELPASLRFALESALLDLLGQRAGLPLSALLSDGPPRRAVTRSALVAGPHDLEGARAALARGISTIKVKLGVRPFDEELAALEQLRVALGDDLAIRLDAGGQWTIPEAREKLGRLADAIEPELCEEPVSGAALLELGETAVPWAADESLALPHLAERILDAKGLHALVLKPALLGGLHRAMALAGAAARRGVRLIVTHLFDGPVALAACCELALALPSEPLPCGLDPHPALAAWPPIEISQLSTPSMVRASGRAGLGLTLPRETWENL